VVGVTSEVSANVSFQGAPARSARSDSNQSSANDSFSALVDSNTAASNADNRPQDTSAAQTPAPRRADDTQAPSDNRSRDNATASDKAASDKAARKDSDNRDDAVNAHNDTDADAKTEASRRSNTKSASTKSDASKSDETKPEAKPASTGGAAAADPTQAKPDGTAEVTANAIATVIPVTTPTATAEAPAATPASDKVAAPLAIAAAAIAATASLTGTADVPATTGTDASATGAATATAAAATKENGAKIDAHAAASGAVIVEATSADPTVTTGIALAASAAAVISGASKAATQVKTQVIAKEATATSGEQDNTAGTTAASAAAPTTIVPAVTPQAEIAGKPKAEGGIVDAAKTDIAGKSAAVTAANAGGNGHAATVELSQTLVNASDTSLQAAGAIQTPQPAAAAAPAPAPQLSVTASTNAAVPLSGLAMEIAASATSGKSRFEIRLDPAELGRIDVRIDVDRNGQVTSHLTVDRPETLSMLRQDANQLQRALDNAGLSTGNSGLQFSLRDQSSQGQNDGGGSNPNAHRLIVAEEDTIPAAFAGRSYGRMLGSSGGVDIRV
jgi:flagellar hook-length control protein FliK